MGRKKIIKAYSGRCLHLRVPIKFTSLHRKGCTTAISLSLARYCKIQDMDRFVFLVEDELVLYNRH